MRMVAAWLLVLLHGCGTSFAAGQSAPVTGESLLNGTLSRPAARLAKAQVLSGRFMHRRHLREVAKPLTAAGEFVFARDLGVYWHTQQPFDSVVVLTPHGILEKTEGSRVTEFSADNQPAVRMIANVFLALFTLDMTSLERNFELTSIEEGARWTIGLKPRAAAISRVFTQATISGGADVEQVVLTDSRDDRTVIDLSGIEYSDTVSAATRGLFAAGTP